MVMGADVSECVAVAYGNLGLVLLCGDVYA